MITPKGLSVLFQTLKQCKSEIKSMKFNRCGFSKDHMILISEFMQGNQHLERLEMGWNRFDDQSIEMLADHLIGNTTLKSLGIREHNGITEKSRPLLIEIAKKTNLIEIDLDFTGLGYGDTMDIKELLCVPLDKRDIPIYSNSKSAAKITAST